MDIGVGFMVVAIVAIVFGTRAWRTWMVAKSQGRSPADEALIGSMQHQIDKLSERVAVLEKLATDDDRRLAGEIDRLRDPRPGASY